MKINYTKRTIELTAKEEKMTSVIGSIAYKELLNARKENQGFDIVVIAKTTQRKNVKYKGLTYDFMKKYILAHDKEDKSIMNEFNTLTGNVKTDKLKFTANYTEVAEWFLSTFQEVKEYREKIDAILNKKAS